MVNSISSGAMSMSQEQLKQQVQMSLLSKSLETAESQGNEMTKMIQESGQAANQQAPITDPAVGQNIDILA